MTCKHCHGYIAKDDDRVIFRSGVTYHLTCYTATITDSAHDMLRSLMLKPDGE